MGQIIVVGVITFIVTGLVGFRKYKSWRWNAVDIIYYPLATLGVILLFANNAAQRKLLELNQVADLKRMELRQTDNARPDVKILTSDELTTTSLKQIEVIPEWHSMCQRGVFNPRCPVAEKLVQPVNTFLQTSQAKFSTQEQKLLSLCMAADRMLDDIARNKRLTYTSDDLVSEYKFLLSKNYRVEHHEEIHLRINNFQEKEIAEAENIYRKVFSEETDDTRFVLGLMKAEVDFSTLILRGLFPCITAPTKQLELLSNWTATKSDQEAEVRRIESERLRLKEVSISSVQVQNWHLNLWPFVLVFALSLKFAKGVATCRKAFEASNADRVVPEEPEDASAEIPVDDTQTSSLEETTPDPAKQTDTV
jgi:hypothetical protein